MNERDQARHPAGLWFTAMDFAHSAVQILAGVACMLKGAELAHSGLIVPAEIKTYNPDNWGEFLSILPGGLLFLAGVLLAFLAATRPTPAEFRRLIATSPIPEPPKAAQ